VVGVDDHRDGERPRVGEHLEVHGDVAAFAYGDRYRRADREAAEGNLFGWTSHVAHQGVQPVLVVHVPVIATERGERPEEPAEHGDRRRPRGFGLMRSHQGSDLLEPLLEVARCRDAHEHRADHVPKRGFMPWTTSGHRHAHHERVKELPFGHQHPMQRTCHCHQDCIVRRRSMMMRCRSHRCEVRTDDSAPAE
jgi:hypothetical protein